MDIFRLFLWICPVKSATVFLSATATNICSITAVTTVKQNSFNVSFEELIKFPHLADFTNHY